ncbi:glycosyl transferase family protein [Mycobacterium bohemicum DSM 44277]|uniref:Glycosyl transferase family 1 n=2 Tax=Mycobacterium bohemicum TaxID=56425 RepID=A0A1X1R6T3_MYCBE|nr:glycosyltransferase [Mycobacterium bohemicum]MCV6969563.1 glycosyltransferase [Mycobacterium bohemicum]ORV00498.1 glycosyl transferase family 1 [Mycobacterium bohemicum]CPR08112.1 glycosyl transferase family protein [Mycobacterium bohemicum DSM 44277]
MKFVLACYGSRGDVEPSVVVGRELQRRGHDVRMAVSPNLVGFTESAGLAAVAYGLDTQALLDAQRNYWTCRFHTPWKFKELNRLQRENLEISAQCWRDMGKTLISLAEGADLLFTGLTFEQPAANVAEYYDIPLATLDYYPIRANGQLLPFLPSPLIRRAWLMGEWMNWRAMKKTEDAQRRELGLPKATRPTSRRITERGSLQIQAYDEVWFPGLAAEWAKFDGQRPFVGTLTMESPTDADEEAASWIAAGTPPIFFGFGTIPIASPADTLAMIAAACAEVGERALVCAGSSDFSTAPDYEHVKVVSTVNYATTFPTCRAVVHHGGAGTLAAGLRAGVPTLILWTLPDQIFWGAQLKRLKVGSARRFSSVTRKSLVSELRTILAPHYLTRAREIATRMTKPAESAAAAADLLESFARVRRCGPAVAPSR